MSSAGTSVALSVSPSRSLAAFAMPSSALALPSPDRVRAEALQCIFRPTSRPPFQPNLAGSLDASPLATTSPRPATPAASPLSSSSARGSSPSLSSGSPSSRSVSSAFAVSAAWPSAGPSSTARPPSLRVACENALAASRRSSRPFARRLPLPSRWKTAAGEAANLPKEKTNAPPNERQETFLSLDVPSEAATKSDGSSGCYGGANDFATKQTTRAIVARRPPWSAMRRSVRTLSMRLLPSAPSFASTGSSLAASSSIASLDPALPSSPLATPIQPLIPSRHQGTLIAGAQASEAGGPAAAAAAAFPHPSRASQASSSLAAPASSNSRPRSSSASCSISSPATNHVLRTSCASKPQPSLASKAAAAAGGVPATPGDRSKGEEYAGAAKAPGIIEDAVEARDSLGKSNCEATGRCGRGAEEAPEGAEARAANARAPRPSGQWPVLGPIGDAQTRTNSWHAAERQRQLGGLPDAPSNEGQNRLNHREINGRHLATPLAGDAAAKEGRAAPVDDLRAAALPTDPLPPAHTWPDRPLCFRFVEEPWVIRKLQEQRAAAIMAASSAGSPPGSSPAVRAAWPSSSPPPSPSCASPTCHRFSTAAPWAPPHAAVGTSGDAEEPAAAAPDLAQPCCAPAEQRPEDFLKHDGVANKETRGVECGDYGQSPDLLLPLDNRSTLRPGRSPASPTSLVASTKTSSRQVPPAVRLLGRPALLGGGPSGMGAGPPSPCALSKDERQQQEWLGGAAAAPGDPKVLTPRMFGGCSSDRPDEGCMRHPAGLQPRPVRHQAGAKCDRMNCDRKRRGSQTQRAEEELSERSAIQPNQLRGAQLRQSGSPRKQTKFQHEPETRLHPGCEDGGNPQDPRAEVPAQKLEPLEGQAHNPTRRGLGLNGEGQRADCTGNTTQRTQCGCCCEADEATDAWESHGLDCQRPYADVTRAANKARRADRSTASGGEGGAHAASEGTEATTGAAEESATVPALCPPCRLSPRVENDFSSHPGDIQPPRDRAGISSRKQADTYLRICYPTGLLRVTRASPSTSSSPSPGPSFAPPLSPVSTVSVSCPSSSSSPGFCSASSSPQLCSVLACTSPFPCSSSAPCLLSTPSPLVAPAWSTLSSSEQNAPAAPSAAPALSAAATAPTATASTKDDAVSAAPRALCSLAEAPGVGRPASSSPSADLPPTIDFDSAGSTGFSSGPCRPHAAGCCRVPVCLSSSPRGSASFSATTTDSSTCRPVSSSCSPQSGSGRRSGASAVSGSALPSSNCTIGKGSSGECVGIEAGRGNTADSSTSGLFGAGAGISQGSEFSNTGDAGVHRHSFESLYFVGELVIRIGGDRRLEDPTYFTGRRRYTQACIQGRFKERYPMSSVLTGITFDSPLTSLPPAWMIRLGLKLFKKLAPAMEDNLTGDLPYVVSPMAAVAQAMHVAKAPPHSAPSAACSHAARLHLDEGAATATTAVGDRSHARRTLPHRGAQAVEGQGGVDVASPVIPEQTNLLGGAFERGMSAVERKKYFATNSNLHKHFYEPDLIYTFELYQHIFQAPKYEFDLGIIKLDPVAYFSAQPVEIMALLDHNLFGRHHQGNRPQLREPDGNVDGDDSEALGPDTFLRPREADKLEGHPTTEAKSNSATDLGEAAAPTTTSKNAGANSTQSCDHGDQTAAVSKNDPEGPKEGIATGRKNSWATWLQKSSATTNQPSPSPPQRGMAANRKYLWRVQVWHEKLLPPTTPEQH
eukprot:GHVT01102405.1.p1 GENE.GHVT01102405.1~~GHVT01102405.1.p1  ORF type:complete len:1720 (-),score=378.35 GHVT01102405.1:783-5942(-)